MSQTSKHVLIEGVFQPQEARDALLEVFTGKIRFHQQKNLSSMERFGKEDEIALRRIPELKEELKRIQRVVQEAEAQQMKLRIHADVQISLSKD